MKAWFVYFFMFLMVICFNNCSPGFITPENPVDENGQGVDIDPESELLKDLSSKIDLIVAPHIDQSGNDVTKPRSMVVGIVVDGESKLLFYGKNDQGKLPNEKSIYPLNSVTKMLTGVIAAKGVVDGDFSISTPISTMVLGSLGSSLDRNIRLGMALAHYSGLPDLPINMYGPTGSPASGYMRSDLEPCLVSLCSSVDGPGNSYFYSNIGIGLVSLGMEDFYGVQNFDELFDLKMAQSLNLTDTHLSEPQFYTSEYANRIVRGRSPSGMLFDPAEMSILAGAGGLLTSGEDMLKIAGMLAEPMGEWSTIMNEATRSIAIKDSNTELAYGFETYYNDSDLVHAKSGGQLAYGSYIAWSPSLKASVFLLIDQGGTRFMKSTADAIIDEFQNN